MTRFWIPHVIFICLQPRNCLIVTILVMMAMLSWLRSRSKIIEKRTVKMKIYDGVIQTVSDVRFIPNLRKNFISLNNLDSLDYDFYAKNESICVSKRLCCRNERNKELNFVQIYRTSCSRWSYSQC